MKKTVALILAAVLLLSSFSALASEGTFRFGQYLPQSGANAVYAEDLLRSVKLAIKEVNAEGGLNGQQMEHIIYDTTSSTEEAAKITPRLVEVDKVDAVLTTPMSNEIQASAQTLMDAGIVTFALGTSPAIIKPEWDYLFRPTLNNSFVIPVLVDMAKKLNMTSAAILFYQGDTETAAAKQFRELCEEAGIAIVAEETYDAGDTDLSAQVINIVNSNPQFVFTAIVSDFVGITTKQLRQFGYDGIIISKEIMPTSQLEIAGKATCNYYTFANPYVTYTDINDCDIPEMKAFLEKFVAEYGELPVSDWSYRGYDAVMTLREAARIAGSNDSAALKAAMSQVKFNGLGGVVDFTKTNEGYQSFNSFIVMDGKTLLFDEWLNAGGYEAFKEATGRDY